jgi:hypothetical protein
MLVLAGLCNAQDELDANARQAVIERVLEDLRSDYVFPDTAEQMVASIRERVAAGEYDAVTRASDLAVQLTEDLRRVSHDRHLGLLYQPPLPVPAQPPPFINRARRVNYGFERTERLAGNIGYIDLRGFEPAWDGGRACAAALSFVADTEALIIDLRNNTGGSPASVASIASYFFAEPTHLSGIYDRRSGTTQELWTSESVRGERYDPKKPLYLLISRGTFSAAEDFAYSLQAAGRATLIGEATGGGAHPVSGRSVGPDLVLMLPHARSINPITHTNWEGVGVQPDIAVPAFEALHVAHDLLLRDLAARNSHPLLTDLLDKQIKANVAALAGLRRAHAAERVLPLELTRGARKTLHASIPGAVAAEFLAALNTGDLGVVQRFRARHSMHSGRDVEDLTLYLESGGFKVHSVVATRSDSITLLAQRKKGAGWATLRFVIDPAVPHPLLNLEVRPARAPTWGSGERR